MRPPILFAALVACGASGASGACGANGAPPAGQPIRFLHTFGPEETELVNAAMAERSLAVESQLVPFARGQQVIREILAAKTACPDLVRIDATWLPGFVAESLLAPVPADLAAADWTPDAAALAAGYGVPQTVDGLVVLRAAAAPAPGDPSVQALVAAARAARTPAIPHPLAVRVDGYWFVAWLRAEGGELAIGGDPVEPLAGEGPARALAAFAALFGDLAPPPPAPGGEAPDELRRWRAHELAYWVTGPWQLAALFDRTAPTDRADLAVSPLAHAPRGGQLLVVPRCAPHPDAGWRLAGELTSPAVEQRLAEAFGTIPTRRGALALAPPLVRAIHDALAAAEPLPASPRTPILFDDLNPAIAAVVAGDATPDEAIAGVRRGWRRLLRAPGAR